MDKKKLYRSIPRVDILLDNDKVKLMIAQYGKEAVRDAVRTEQERLREYIAKCESEENAVKKIADICEDNNVTEWEVIGAIFDVIEDEKIDISEWL